MVHHGNIPYTVECHSPSRVRVALKWECCLLPCNYTDPIPQPFRLALKSGWMWLMKGRPETRKHKLEYTTLREEHCQIFCEYTTVPQPPYKLISSEHLTLNPIWQYESEFLYKKVKRFEIMPVVHELSSDTAHATSHCHVVPHGTFYLGGCEDSSELFSSVYYRLDAHTEYQESCLPPKGTLMASTLPYSLHSEKSPARSMLIYSRNCRQ